MSDADLNSINALWELHQSGRSQQALAPALLLLKQHPDVAALRLLCAALQQRLADWQGASTHLQHVLKARPQQHNARHDLAICLHQLGQPQQALRHYQLLLGVLSNNADLHFNMALSLQACGELSAAMAQLKQALDIAPHRLDARVRLTYLYRLCCMWEQADRQRTTIEHDIGQLGESDHAQAQAAAIAPYELIVAQVGDAAHARIARACAQAAARTSPTNVSHTRILSSQRNKINIGYLSADFCAHAVGSLIAGLFAEHDRQRVTVQAFALKLTGDDIEQTVRKGVEQFHDLSQLSNPAAIAVLREAGLDVLVDLGGYTRHSRPQLLAARPAPVQISWLGYLHTMAAPFIDYIVADEHVLPPEHHARYTEQPLHLGCFAPISPLPAPALEDTARSHGLPPGKFVFCSFNNTYKLDPQLFDVWLDLLLEVPNSVLWLYAHERLAQRQLRKAARARGVDTQRVIFAPRMPLAKHLARMRHADLFLDTQHYNAGATAAAALQQGLPILTLTGDSFLGRMSTSFNRMLALETLICSDLSTYRERAASLALSPSALAAIGAQLRANRHRLLDLRARCRELEQQLFRICGLTQS